MKPRIYPFSLLAVALSVHLTFAQSNQGSNPTKDAAPSAARVLAGVREYPEPVVDALVTLARHPDWLDKAVAKLKANQDPAADDPAMPEAIRAAMKTLSPIPEAIMLAGARRDELNLLRDVRVEAPQGADVRTKQLRSDYSAAKREGELRWQQALQGNDAALNAYRELLTKFTAEMRKQVPNFAVVEVTDRNYYLVCPPDEVIMGFAQQKKAPESVWRLMTEWFDRYGTDRVDEQLLGGQSGIGATRAENALIDAAADRRKSMFRADDGQLGDSLGFVPVALQPLADQPEEARMAFAIAEHERLWAPAMSGQPNPQAGGDMAMAAPRGDFDGADVRIEPPSADGSGADVVITPARPEMIIPPGRATRVTHDQPVVIASAYDDDVVVDGREPDAMEIRDGQTEVVVEDAPAVVYDYAPSVYAAPYYSYPSFGFGFGFSSYFGSCYPYSYYRSCYPYSYYPSYGCYSYYGPCGRAYSYYPRFCDRNVYARPYGGYGYGYGGYGHGYGHGYGSGYGSGYGRNGNYPDQRAGYSSNRSYGGRYYSGGRGGSPYAYNRGGGGGALSQGQYYPNNAGVGRTGPRTLGGRGNSSMGGVGQGVTPRTITRSDGIGREGVGRRGGDGGSTGRVDGAAVSRGDGVRRTEPSNRPHSLRPLPRSDLQRAPTRSMGAQSSGSRDSGSAYRGLKSPTRSIQTSPAPRSSFNRSSVFRGGGGGSRMQSNHGGGSRSMQRGGGRN
jgi:hypothetical protein